MSKTSQAAKAVPEPQGTENVKSAQTALFQAREAAAAALRELMSTVFSVGQEALSGMHDRELGVLLTEAARARDDKTIVLIALSMRGTANLHLAADEAEAMLGIGYSMPDDAFLADGKNTNLADLLVSAIRKVPKADGADGAMRRLIRAKVRTGPFLDQAMRSSMQLADKIEALDLSDKDAQLSDEAMDVLETQLIRQLEHGSDIVMKAIPKVAEAMAARGWDEAKLIMKLVSHRDCAYAALVAKAFPKAFDMAQAEVLKSGCPEALAAFWQEHSPRCDKKVFHERLTEALRPDPSALAEAILDNKKYGGRFPMMHPMMLFSPDMVFMQRKRR